MKNFVHLHVHSEFSFLDGASRISELVSKAAELNMPSIAITDHDNLSAAVRFIKTARDYGIKPVIGAEVTLNGGYHLTLLCRNNEGYRNLCCLLTKAHLENTRGKPQVSLDTLRMHSRGLIALTGCRRGAIPSLILKKDFTAAQRVARVYKDIFGPESLFIELSETLLPGSSSLNKYLFELAQVEGLRCVATNNVHYVSKDDFFVHDILTCIRTLTKLNEPHPERRLNAENYLKSPDELKDEFKEYPEAFQTAFLIAQECECPLELGKTNFPSYPVPEDFRSPGHFLRHMVFQGAQRRYGTITDKIRERLEYELSVIEHLGYEDYFLVVWDLVRFARQNGIRHAGRGSAADSAVAYCLDIADVDPIAHNLLFERFLSIERGEKPDIDVDFDARRRDEIASYVYSKYGETNVAAVAAYNTFQARAAIRDAGKAMGYSPEEIDLLAKRLPHLPASLLKQAFTVVPELRDINIPRNKLEILLKAAERLADLPRFLSTHLGGLVISRDPITWFSPLQKSAKGVNILQFDKDDVEDLGLVKIDILSLRTLSAVEDSLKYLDQKGSVDYERIPLDDDQTFKMLRRADTVGVFQLESPAQRALQARLNADNIEDVVASVALIRPGPIKGNMVEPFIMRRQGLEDVVYLDPRLEPILKKTFGVILFQEQVIEIASVIAGFTPGEADRLRRVMTHGRSEREMQALGQLFIDKAVERGVPQETAEKIFQCIRGYASYGFCEAHARAFGTTAYKTAYLIAHYPAEFFAAILNNEPMGFYPPSTICVVAKSRGVGILGPSINRSYKDATVENRSIRLPLKMVRDLSEKDIENIIAERTRNGEYRTFNDFAQRVKVSIDGLRSLVLCGAFDEFRVSRKKLLWALSDYCSDRSLAQTDLLIESQEVLLEPGSPASEFSLAEKIALEYAILGVGVSGHPVEIWRDALRKKGFTSSLELPAKSPGNPVRVAGLPVRPHRPPTRSGKTVVFLSLEDEHGLIDVTCFEDVYERYGKYIFSGEFEPLGVFGQVQKRGAAFSVLANSVFPISRIL